MVNSAPQSGAPKKVVDGGRIIRQLVGGASLQASMEGVANASAWLEEEAADMDGKQGAHNMGWFVLFVMYKISMT